MGWKLIQKRVGDLLQWALIIMHSNFHVLLEIKIDGYRKPNCIQYTRLPNNSVNTFSYKPPFQPTCASNKMDASKPGLASEKLGKAAGSASSSTSLTGVSAGYLSRMRSSSYPYNSSLSRMT